MLCIATSLIFAASAAAGVVNRAEHAAGTQVHPHEHVAFSDVTVDHDAHHAPAGGDPAADHDAGSVHHHHGDAPTAYLTAAKDLGRHVSLDRAELRAAASPFLSGEGVGGLERPPRRAGKPI